MAIDLDFEIQQMARKLAALAASHEAMIGALKRVTALAIAHGIPAWEISDALAPSPRTEGPADA